jgi:hypothetical protein
LPISPTSTQIYTIVSEGWLLWYITLPRFFHSFLINCAANC